MLVSKDKGQKFIAEKVKCLHPTCKTEFAQKFVIEAMQKVSALSSDKPFGQVKDNRLNQSAFYNGRGDESLSMVNTDPMAMSYGIHNPAPFAAQSWKEP